MKHVDNLAAAYTRAVCHNPQGVVFENIKAAVDVVPLYAAAPELLEACESLLLELIHKGEYDTSCIMAMNSAEKIIKKARGE